MSKKRKLLAMKGVDQINYGFRIVGYRHNTQSPLKRIFISRKL